MRKKIEQYDVVIIGGGAAGLTAGIYCGRARLKTLILEKALVGGLATYTNEVENYPGFPDGSTGLELMNLFQKQAKKFGVDFKLTDVKSVSLEGEDKVVETFRNEFHCKVVIIASGGKPRLTGAPGEDKYLYDKGISFCATCDAAANTGKTVMVIGSGDAAIEEGMFLTKFASKVIVSVLHDEGIMDCNEIAKGEALKNEKMEFLWNTSVAEFRGDEERLRSVALKNAKTGEIQDVPVDACFIFIGYLPNTELFRGMIDMNRAGYVLTNEQMETRIPGVFCAGDVREKFLRQVATAVGDGAIAGYAAEKYIAESEMFENQVMGESPRLVYVYNAANAEDREMLGEMEKYGQAHDGLRLIKADVYKSAGIAQRLNVPETPCVAVISENKILGYLSCKDISCEALDLLVAQCNCASN
jgi:thioredoxin reductase (NADPH)